MREELQEYVERHDDGRVTLTLQEPVELKGGKRVESLTFVKPRGKHLRQMDNHKGGDIEKGYFLMANLTGQTLSVFDEMSVADLQAAQEVVEELTGKLPDGEQS